MCLSKFHEVSMCWFSGKRRFLLLTVWWVPRADSLARLWARRHDMWVSPRLKFPCTRNLAPSMADRSPSASYPNHRTALALHRTIVALRSRHCSSESLMTLAIKYFQIISVSGVLKASHCTLWNSKAWMQLGPDGCAGNSFAVSHL